jgi:hypothetical protein
MKSSWTKILVGFAMSAVTVISSYAANPPFTQCSPSGYNCNLLITLDKFGNLRVDTDPNLPWYPPENFDIGKLIGFQNNSRATVYSLSFMANSGNDLSWICDGPSPYFHAANVSIVNIPWGPNWPSEPGYFRYTLPWPYVRPWAFSCDAVFSGGVPKGGSTYFSLDNPYFSVTTKNVIPFVSFQSGIAKGQTATATITLYPSPSPVTVTLNLATTSGTGSAVFASNNGTSMTVTQSGTVQIKAVTASSVANNVELRALVSGEIRSRAAFTVVDTTLSCTSPVTRGQSTTCQPSIGPTGSSYSWKFTDANNNVVSRADTSSATWQGIMVASGTVDLTIDGVALTPATATVNDRTNFAFTAVPPIQVMSNTLTCYDGTTTVLPSPPTDGSQEGFSCANMAFDTTRVNITDGGPNNGYWYVSSVSDSSGNLPTKFEHIVVSDLLDSTSTFYTSQCGTYSSSNPAGFIAGSKLKQNVFEHEQGSVLSHWTQYRDAQNNSSNNIGTIIEAIIGTPGTSPPQFADNVRNAGMAAIDRIAQAINEQGVCGGSVNHDSSQSCKYCGPINFAPYQSCGGATPVPYCQ